MNEDGLVRLALPPKVANAIARQRAALTARARSKAAKLIAQERKVRGEVPGFMKARSGAGAQESWMHWDQTAHLIVVDKATEQPLLIKDFAISQREASITR